MKIKNVAHLTINTQNVVVYPNDSVIFDETKPVMQDMMEQAKKTGIVSVMNDQRGNIKARCNLNLKKGAYMATLYNEKIPEISLLETAGALNAEAGKEVWKHMEALYKMSWGMNAPVVKCPKEPFICDFIYPGIISSPWITYWSGDFTKCFGISVLNMMLQYNKILEMDPSTR